MGGDTRREAVASLAQVAAAERLADVLITAFAQCDEAGRALTDLQKIDLLVSAFAGFDGFGGDLESLLRSKDIVSGFGDSAKVTGGFERRRLRRYYGLHAMTTP